MSGTSQRFVAYERVSTRRQGLSGLGLEAQRKSIDVSSRPARRRRTSAMLPTIFPSELSNVGCAVLYRGRAESRSRKSGLEAAFQRDRAGLVVLYELPGR
jgi:hypothetical protein